LAQLIKFGDSGGAFGVPLSLREEHREEFIETSPQGEELVEWLEENDYDYVLKTMHYKQIFAGVLTDFLHFVYEGIRCTGKGKTTVAFSNFRKPFKQNLFLLERLLVEPKELVDSFQKGEPKEYHPEAISPERRIKIIDQSMEAVNGVSPLKAEMHYDLRYNKNAEDGLEALWNKAVHLVTTKYETMKTEPSNLNFIYSTPEAIDEQRQFLYYFLPCLLSHAVKVSEALFFNFVEQDETIGTINRLRRTVGFFRWAQTYPGDLEINTEPFEELIEPLDTHLAECPNCGEHINYDDENLDRFYWKGTIHCSDCAEETLVSEILKNIPDESIDV